MLKPIYRRLAALLAGTSAICLSSAAAAQAASEDVAALTEVVVTAQRRTESLQDVPMSVDVASGETLQKFNLFDAKDVQQLSPGLQITNTDGRSNSATLRGVSFNPDQGTSPSVDFYLNDVPTDAQTLLTAIYDIQQIEVLRGPQGALRGRTSPGGAITIRTRRPDLSEFDGYAQGAVTDRHAYNVQAAVSMPIVPGKLAARLAVLKDRNRINDVYNITRDEHSRGDTESARLSLLFAPEDNLSVSLTYQYLDVDNRLNQQVLGAGNAPSAAFGDPTRSGPPLDAGDRAAVTEEALFYRNKSHFLNFAVDWDLGPATLAFVGGHQDTVLSAPSGYDLANAIPGYASRGILKTRYDVNVAEVRLYSNNQGGFWNWSLSAFASEQGGGVTSRDNTADAYFGPFPYALGLYLPISTSLFIPVNAKTRSIAASSRFAFTDKLTLEMAARYSRNKGVQVADVTVNSPGYPGLPAFGIPAIPGFGPLVTAIVPPALAVTTERPLTGGATLTYELNSDFTFYAAYGRSFRNGTTGVGVPANISEDLIRSKPEKSDSFELGMKSYFLDRKYSLNVAAFYQTFDGYLFRTPADIAFDNGSRNAFNQPVGAPDGVVDGFFGFNYNGDATTKGVEVTFAGRPLENWDFSIGAAYAKARFDGARTPCNDYNGDGTPDAVGLARITGGGNVSYCDRSDRLGEAPDFSLTANTEVRFPVGGLEAFTRALVYYRPGFNSTVANFDYDDQELVSLFLGVRDLKSGWEVSVFAKNLLDQTRITNISQGEATITTSSAPYRSGYRSVNTTRPREIGITANFNF